jgi:hypothetical protein
MNKKLYTKRVELFKKEFPDYKTSKAGNFYEYIGLNNSEHYIESSGFNTTKNMLVNIGKKTDFNKKSYEWLLMITPRGKLMAKQVKGGFRNLSLQVISYRFNRNLTSKIKELFFIGRKYDYLKDYPKLWKFRMFQNCNSLNEAKKFLGFEFISDSKFLSLFEGKNHLDIIALMVRAKNKPNLVSLLGKINEKNPGDLDLLVDWVVTLGGNDVEVDFPRSINKLRELHDAVVAAQNVEELENYSKEIKFKSNTKHIEDLFLEQGLIFDKLETPHALYNEGIIRKHCIGTSYVHELNRMSFYTINDLDKEVTAKYTLAIHSGTGSIGQFYGYRNVNPPKELKNIIDTINKLEVKGINGPGFPTMDKKVFRHVIQEQIITGEYPNKTPDAGHLRWTNAQGIPILEAQHGDDLPF